MGSKKYRRDTLEATTGAVSWEILEADDFDVKRICLSFLTAPAGLENVEVWLRSSLGSDFDCKLRTVDPNGCNSISIEDVNGVIFGDYIEVVYANTDGIEVSGHATVEL